MASSTSPIAAASFPHRAPRTSIGAKPVAMQTELSVDRTASKKYNGLLDSSENSDASLGDIVQYHLKNINARISSTSTLSTDGLSDHSDDNVSVSERAAFFEERWALGPPHATVPKSRMSRRASTGAHCLFPQPPQQRQEAQMANLDNVNNRSLDLSQLISTFEQKLDEDSQHFRGYQPDLQHVDLEDLRRQYQEQNQLSCDPIALPRQRCMRRSSISRGSGVELELARRRSMIPTSIQRDDSSSSDDESVDLRSTLKHYGSNRSFRRNSMAGGTSSSSLLLGNPDSQNVIETMAVSLTLDSGYQSSFANRRGSARINGMKLSESFENMCQENLEADIPPRSFFDQGRDYVNTEFSLVNERQRLGYEDMDTEAVLKTKVNSLRPSMRRGGSFGQDEEDEAAERQRLGYEDMDTEVVLKTKVNSLRPNMRRGGSFGRDDEDEAAERQRLGYEDTDAGMVQKTKVNSLRPSMKRGSSFGQEEEDEAAERQRLGYEDMDAGVVQKTSHASNTKSEDHYGDQVLLRLEDICGPESICRASLVSEPKVYSRMTEDIKESKSSHQKSKGKPKKADVTKEPKPKVSPNELFGEFLLAMKASVDRQTSKQAKKQRKKEIKEIMAVMNTTATRRKLRDRKKAQEKRGGTQKPKVSRRRSIACPTSVELECSQTTAQPPMSPVTNKDIGKYCKKELRAFLAKQQQKEEELKSKKEIANKMTARRRRRASMV